MDFFSLVFICHYLQTYILFSYEFDNINSNEKLLTTNQKKLLQKVDCRHQKKKLNLNKTYANSVDLSNQHIHASIICRLYFYFIFLCLFFFVKLRCYLACKYLKTNSPPSPQQIGHQRGTHFASTHFQIRMHLTYLSMVSLVLVAVIVNVKFRINSVNFEIEKLLN